MIPLSTPNLTCSLISNSNISNCKLTESATSQVQSRVSTTDRIKVLRVAEVGAKFWKAQNKRSEVAAETGHPSIVANAL